MELKVYLNILQKKWWVVLPTFLATFIITVVLTYLETPTYRATATFVVSPSAAVGDVRNFTTGLGLLSREAAVGGTYAEVAMSDAIEESALDFLGLDSATGYSVASRILAGTNVMEITVEGPDPVVTQNLTNGIGTKTIEYVDNLYTTFVISFLDKATLPDEPIKPVKSTNLALGAIFGLVLGSGLAFLAEYLTASPLQSIVATNIIDLKTGGYNKSYFLQRLGEEMIRAKRNRYPLSLTLIRIEHLDMLQGKNASLIQTEFLRQATVLLKQHLREEDIIAYLDENVFAILLPDISGENARGIMEYLQTRIAWADFRSEIGNVKLNITSTSGVAAYNYNGMVQEELLEQAHRALQLAAVSENGRIHLTTPEIISASAHPHQN